MEFDFDQQGFNRCFDAQESFFDSGATLPREFRLDSLVKLKKGLQRFEPRILEALEGDLGKPSTEAFGSEIGFLYAELSHAIKHLRKWMKPRRVKTPFFLFPSKSKIVPSPKGTSLIIGPWNYPVHLLLAPLIGSIAAGKTANLKPSELAPCSARLVQEIIESLFSPDFVAVFQGEGSQAIPAMMQARRFDHIFFTGSTRIGQSIAEQAARQLVPVTLELGGKSPAIVDANSQVKLAAKRIAWGKFFNSGQTCVAPDYLVLHSSVREEFLAEMEKVLERFYGQERVSSPSLARIVNLNHFRRLIGQLEDSRVLIGGRYDESLLRIEPTLVSADREDHPLWSEEIFGPILPLVTFNDQSEIPGIVARHPNPLALYLFSNDQKLHEKTIQKIPFGGGCINDVVAHLANPNLPFGGVGWSGTGRYHGKYSFDEFSHQKGIMTGSRRLDLPFRYPPYDEGKLKLFRRLLK
ncbi:MAG: aldehyde dehydrogenase family protein [Planctomycetota bacterium]|nr:aldehyde dehydrogenase family protein [Planctomycetota bacterium]